MPQDRHAPGGLEMFLLFRCGTLSLPHGTLRIEYQPK